MYKQILLALEHSDADRVLVAHVSQLASLLGSELLLVHVADGWVARFYDQLDLAASEEMRDDWRYLQESAERIRKETGLSVDIRLALGDPSTQIVRVAEEADCDLIALTSHGHRVVGDFVYGSTIGKVRHRTHIPILAIHQNTGEAGPISPQE